MDIYLQFNLGDDLFLDILAKKFPDCLFTVNYLGNNYDNFFQNYHNVQRRKYTLLNKIGQRLKISDSISNYDNVAENHDALLFIGGSIFREETYHNALYNERLKMVNEFKKQDKKVFVLGANFGPFKTDDFFQNYKEFFRLCDDVCFRDQYSFHLFKDLKQVRYAPDIVFQMDISNYKHIKMEKKVGFSIIDVRHKHGLSDYHVSYVNSTVKAIQNFVDKGFECYLISFCDSEGDLKVIKEILLNLSPKVKESVHIYEYKGNLKEAISLIASFKLLIAARFHANILGLLLGIGLMPIIYSNKTLNMLEDLKHTDVIINMDELSLQYDCETIEKTWTNCMKLDQVSQVAINQFASIDQFINQDVFRGVI
ncbi:polysaccharide pyruvyl transferase family protein [Metabacillus sp. cB07]|uniref:polysaccharide pyruvyl transferase family protein n=1 Tax=Metabacillus sp. cB07 TaxID=2806989 RepID=UPI001F5C47C3|nr:polysaccharide pyruvyl transferase family protein [Metabacillus sp. cB07]